LAKDISEILFLKSTSRSLLEEEVNSTFSRFRAQAKTHASFAIISVVEIWANAYLPIIQTRRKQMNIRQKVQQFVSRRRAIRELGAMDDHLLADIGVSRSQIQSAVFGK